MAIPKRYAAAAALIAVVLYLSLYPFQWRPHLLSDGPLFVFTRSWRTWPENRGDFITNIAFYLPCGYFVIKCFKSRIPVFVRLLGTFLLCTTLSVALELSQFYIAYRFSDIRDTYANSIGALLGAAASLIFDGTEHKPLVANIRANPFPMFLLAAFVSARLYPYVPVMDSYKYLDALRSLSAFVVPAADEIFLGTECWMAVYFILEYVFGRRPVIPLVIGIAALVFVGQVVIDTTVGSGEVLGAILALPLSILLTRVLPNPPALFAVIFTVAVVIERLQPFAFNSMSHSFGWFPFAALVHSTNEHTVVMISEKSFLYGTLIWLWVAAGLQRLSATIGVSLLLLLCSFAEVHIPGHVAETTDAALALLLGGFMLRPDKRRDHGRCARRAHPLETGAVQPLENTRDNL